MESQEQFIARICHEVNRAYCASLGDTSQPAWSDAPQWQKDSALVGVRMHLTNPNPRRPLVCFATIPPSQWSIHDRLLNWAKWARGSENQSGGTDSPTFCKFIPDEPRSGGHEAELTYVPLDTDDAIKVAKAVGHLPPQKRASIHWYYLKGGRHPAGKAKEMGVEVQRLSDLVRDARTLLIQWCG